jgi:hypothetical protein
MPPGAVKLRSTRNLRNLSRSLKSQAAAYGDRNPPISLFPQMPKFHRSNVDIRRSA